MLILAAPDPKATDILATNRAKSGLDSYFATLEDMADKALFADTDGRGMREDQFQHSVPVIWAAKQAKDLARPGFFHHDRCCPDIKGTRFQQDLAGKGQVFSCHVIKIAGQLKNIVSKIPGFLVICRRLSCFGLTCHSQHGPQAVWLAKIALAQAIANIADSHGRHWSETAGKMAEQCRASRRAKLSLNLAAIDR